MAWNPPAPPVSFRLIVVAGIVLPACSSTAYNAVTAAGNDPFRLAEGIAPVAQQVHLYIDPDETGYSGRTRITIEVDSASPDVRLHAGDMQIDFLSMSREGTDLDVAFEFGEHDLLIIEAAEGISAGTYELAIDFTNDFNIDGVGINRTELDGRHYIYSQFEAIDARQAFPCFDEPGFKFPWQMTMTVPSEVTPITNTPVASVAEAGGRKTVVFEVTQPLPSYLIAVAVGPFETVPITGMSIPGRVVVPYGKSHLAAAAVETTPALLAFLEDYFGEPYPFEKLDLIATNQAFSGAMEHPGAITYSDFLLLLDETASQEQRSTLVRITAHELAHQWFGNLVTMQWWNDLWLNESFADWMGEKTVQAVYPELSDELDELRVTFRIMDLDARPTTKPIRHDFKSTDNFEDGIYLAYYKGKAALNMFEQAVGPERFRAGVVRYLQKYSRRNARAADFWAEIDAGSGVDPVSGLASFIEQPGIPLVTVSEIGNGRYAFSQSRMITGPNEGDADQQWIIPMRFKYASDGETATMQLVLDEVVETVKLDRAVDWILPNADQRGYFRWSIPDEMLAAVSGDAATQLTVRERMGLLTNLWALLSADKVDGDDYLGAVRGIAVDTHPAVIRAMLDQLRNVRITFVTPELRESFAAFLRVVLAPTLDRIGTEPDPGDTAATTELRPQVLLWLADYGGDARARRSTSAVTEAFLAGEIPPSGHVDVALRTQARLGGTELFDTLRDRFEAATTPGERRRYVQAIGSFREPDAVEAVLDYMLEGPLKPNDISTVLTRLSSWPDNGFMLLAWVMENDAALRERLPAGSMASIPRWLIGCSTENVDTIRAFYGATERFVPGIDDELDEAAADASECVALRQREIEPIRRYLLDVARQAR